jgi:hypothetical protein
MMTFAALVVAAILVASILYACFRGRSERRDPLRRRARVWRLAVLRNRDSDVTTTDIRA